MSEEYRVAIVGANGQVGVSLSILLRERGMTVQPVVRNKIGAALFDHHGFDYRIGEITTEAEAADLLHGADAVIIAAFAPWFGGPKPKAARQINTTIVENSVKLAPPDATIIYFSSLVAYGSEIGLSNWHWYGRTKRHLESVIEQACKRDGRPWYGLRLGHVYGPNQGHTQTLIDALSDRERVILPVSPDRETNIVHSVVLARAVEHCIEGTPDSGRIGVVNQPQWTWNDLVSHYVPETDVVFRPELATQAQAGSQAINRTLATLIGRLDSQREVLMSLLLYLPDRFSTYLDHALSSSDAADAISRYNDKLTYEHRHFNYGPMPSHSAEVPPASTVLDDEKQLCETLGIEADRAYCSTRTE